MPDPETQCFQLSFGPFEAKISAIGANLVRFRRYNRDLILGLADVSAHVSGGFYAGAIVGPVANRISKGQVKIDGQLFQMELNEAGKAALHSGTDGLHTQVWNVLNTTQFSVKMSCHLPDNHGGLPGNRDITVEYILEDTGLVVIIEAITDQKTPINIAHHPYWALDADQSKTRLTVHADSYLPKDQMGLPTGEQLQCAGSFYDFTSPRLIGPDAQIDHNWCLSTAKTDTPRRVVTVRAQDGLQLDIETTEVGVQIYTGAALPTFAPSDCNGAHIKPNVGLALEPQGWPNAPNHPSFPSILLDTDKIYRQVTRYVLSQT